MNEDPSSDGRKRIIGKGIYRQQRCSWGITGRRKRQKVHTDPNV
jgi:hypothetical protein